MISTPQLVLHIIKISQIKLFHMNKHNLIIKCKKKVRMITIIIKILNLFKKVFNMKGVDQVVQEAPEAPEAQEVPEVVQAEVEDFLVDYLVGEDPIKIKV